MRSTPENSSRVHVPWGDQSLVFFFCQPLPQPLHSNYFLHVFPNSKLLYPGNCLAIAPKIIESQVSECVPFVLTVY